MRPIPVLDKNLYFEASIFYIYFCVFVFYKNLYFKETDGGGSRPIWSNESPLRNLFRIPQTKAELSKDYYWQFAFEIVQLDVKGCHIGPHHYHIHDDQCHHQYHHNLSWC